MKGWKTVIFNILALLPIVLEAALAVLVDPEFSRLIPDEWTNYYIVAVGVANLILRVLTTTPVGKKS